MACSIAEINEPILISENEAILFDYSYGKASQLKDFDQPIIVAFIDFGFSSSTFTIAKFEMQNGELQATILTTESDKNLGGRDLDFELANKFQ